MKVRHCGLLAALLFSVSASAGGVPALDQLLGRYNNWASQAVYPIYKPGYAGQPGWGGVIEISSSAYEMALADEQGEYAIQFRGGENKGICQGVLRPIDVRRLGALPVLWGRHGMLVFRPYRIVPTGDCGFVSFEIGYPGQPRRFLDPVEVAIFSTVEDLETGMVFGRVQMFNRIGAPGAIGGGAWIQDSQFVGHPDEREPEQPGARR